MLTGRLITHQPSIFTRWCRVMASNQAHSLDAAMTINLHTRSHRRGASDVQRLAAQSVRSLSLLIAVYAVFASGCTHNLPRTSVSGGRTVAALNETANDSAAAADERCI